MAYYALLCWFDKLIRGTRWYAQIYQLYKISLNGIFIVAFILKWFEYFWVELSWHEVSMSSFLTVQTYVYALEFPLHARTFNVLILFDLHLSWDKYDNQDNQHGFRWYHLQFHIFFGESPCFRGFHTLTFIFVRMSWVLFWLPS